jgi:hypothetical protein
VKRTNRVAAQFGSSATGSRAAWEGAVSTLRADAQGIDAFIDFDAQALGGRVRAAPQQVGHVDGTEQRLLGQGHGLFGRAAHAQAQHPRRTPARAHAG